MVTAEQTAVDVAGGMQAQAPPTPSGILQLGLAFWGSKALLSAVELGVFTNSRTGRLGRTSSASV